MRTILIEVEHKHSIEKAVERIRGYPAGRKVIVWSRGVEEGYLRIFL